MSFFTYDKKRYATEDLATCYECAEKAGMKDALFVSFGLLLGIVREGDFIGHDNDVDLCVKADKIAKQQEDDYVRLLHEAGMFFARDKKSHRQDTGRTTWFSLRKRSGRAKFCHWLGFEWSDYWWWSKAGKWISARKFDEERWDYAFDDDAIMLGIPAEYTRELMWIKFRGVDVQIPTAYGGALDYMYPGWPVPKKGGSSRKQTVCIVPNWDDSRTWRIKVA